MRKIVMRSGADSIFNFQSIYNTLERLFHTHKIDPKWMLLNTAKFCTYESVIQLAEKEFDNENHIELHQDNLVKLFIDKTRQTSLHAMGPILKIECSKTTNFYYKLLHIVKIKEPYVLSLGIGILFSALLPELYQERLQKILMNININYDAYIPKSEYGLIWE